MEECDMPLNREGEILGRVKISMDICKELSYGNSVSEILDGYIAFMNYDLK